MWSLVALAIFKHAGSCGVRAVSQQHSENIYRLARPQLMNRKKKRKEETAADEELHSSEHD